MRQEDLEAHLVAAALPALLFAAYAVFRRLYMLALASAIYAPATEPAAADEHPIASSDAASLDVRWVDATTVAAIPSSAASAKAHRRATATRFAYAVSGAVLIAFGAALLFHRLTASGIAWRGASVIAFLNTFVGVGLVLLFVRPPMGTVVGTVALWIAAYFALVVGVVGRSWDLATAVLADNVIVTMSLPAFLIGPFALRIMRPLVVAFVPIVAFFILVVTLTAAAFRLFDLPLSGEPGVAASLGGLIAVILAVALVVRGVRRGQLVRVVAVCLVGLVAASWLLWATDSLVAAFILGIFVNSTFVLLCCAVLWAAFRLKARGYVSDEGLHFVGCCLLYTLTLAAAAPMRWSQVPALVLSFVSYLLILHGILLRGRPAAEPPRRLLLLRVFQKAPIRSWLMDLLDDRWRRIGSVDTIVGLDLALRTLNVLALQDFLLGRVDRRFLNTPEDVRTRLAALPSHLSVDRRYPLNELHCSPDTWRTAVTLLLTAADVVLIDLRGLRATNRGALYELTLAARCVSLDRLVVVADARTDRELVERAVHDAHPPSRPNDSSNAHTLDVLRLGTSATTSRRAVSQAIFAALSAASDHSALRHPRAG